MCEVTREPAVCGCAASADYINKRWTVDVGQGAGVVRCDLLQQTSASTFVIYYLALGGFLNKSHKASGEIYGIGKLREAAVIVFAR